MDREPLLEKTLLEGQRIYREDSLISDKPTKAENKAFGKYEILESENSFKGK
ncbi:MAG: hypothetical protein RMI63_00835 [Caldimicrobium sp.]|nr:hypothetical protein [Caldimicrobium sp.]MDW8093554.1 hypothetical protein [Caldimicrobium sp.]